jgi:hypothetical protein
MATPTLPTVKFEDADIPPEKQVGPLTNPDIFNNVTSNVDPSLQVDTGARLVEPFGDASMPVGDPLVPRMTPASNTDLQALLMKQLQQQQAPQPDLYDTLSKTQRRMLAFAAIEDAGNALGGRPTGAVEALLGNFTELRDQQRKRDAAAVQQQIMSSLVGGLGGFGDMSGEPQTPEEHRARAQMLSRMIMMQPSMADQLGTQVQYHLSEAERLAAEEGVMRGQAEGASFVLETSQELRDMIENNPNITGIKGMFLSAIPTTEAAEARLDVQTLRSRMALSALLNIKEKGATLGQVSNQELALLEADIAALNLNQSKDAVLRDLQRIDNRYQGIVRNLYADNANNERGMTELDRIFNGRPNYVTGDAPNVITYTFDTVPEGEIFKSRDGSIYRFNGGDKQSSSAWTKLN